MRLPWSFFVALRYFRTKRRQKRITLPLISSFGIGVGVMALISVIGVMNGFQIGFIEDILNISSYHLRIYPASGDSLDPSFLEILKKEGDISVAIEMSESQSLLKGRSSGLEIVSLQGMDPRVNLLDQALLKQLRIIEGGFSLEKPGSIILGSQLASSLVVGVGDTLEIYGFNQEQPGGFNLQASEFIVTGIFDCGYYQYDRYLGFLSLEDAGKLSPASFEPFLGIKLKNRYRDERIIEKLRNILPPDWKIESWRDYNRSFFSALRMEKLILALFLGLIFLVVGVNIKHFLEREILEKREEIAVFRALGATPSSIRWIFTLEGFVMGFFGSLGGLITGLLISRNINAVFIFTEKLVNFLIRIGSFLYSSLTPRGEDFSLFSPAYFYLEEVPSILLPREIFLTLFFAIAISTLSAYRAAFSVSSISPTQVLRGTEL